MTNGCPRATVSHRHGTLGRLAVGHRHDPHVVPAITEEAREVGTVRCGTADVGRPDAREEDDPHRAIVGRRGGCPAHGSVVPAALPAAGAAARNARALSHPRPRSTWLGHRDRRNNGNDRSGRSGARRARCRGARRAAPAWSPALRVARARVGHAVLRARARQPAPRTAPPPSSRARSSSSSRRWASARLHWSPRNSTWRRSSMFSCSLRSPPTPSG